MIRKIRNEIGGLTVGTLLTLIVIPVVYSLLDRKPELASSERFPAESEGPAPLTTAVPEALRRVG